MLIPEKIKMLICLNFIVWMLFTSCYSYFILGGLKSQTFPLSQNPILLTDNQEIKLFQRERGGVRRVGRNGVRNITKTSFEKFL
ncbi:MAG: hypothetical protein EAZ76_12805 [Nostocales cyanobacterium]|nr:MAG: hypothetical protein EAZ87_13865 [Nostocales cyanobacterium]TAF12946.1 MAG: hypothetical protein EAZ76_12805 [Nostocales cyanobacterium]